MHDEGAGFAATNFLLKLVYLFDIFNKLNVLNLSMQDSNMYIFQLLEKIAVFGRNMQLWIRKIQDWLQNYIN